MNYQEELDLHNFLMLQRWMGPAVNGLKSHDEEAQKLKTESYLTHKQTSTKRNAAQKPLYTLPSLETVMARSLIGSPSSERLQVGGSLFYRSGRHYDVLKYDDLV